MGGEYFCTQVTYKFQNRRLEKDCRFWLIFGVDCKFEIFYETLMQMVQIHLCKNSQKS